MPKPRYNQVSLEATPYYSFTMAILFILLYQSTRFTLQFKQ